MMIIVGTNTSETNNIHLVLLLSLKFMFLIPENDSLAVMLTPPEDFPNKSFNVLESSEK